MDELNAITLKKKLWETLHGIKSGKLDAADGDAIASQAREILRTTKIQLMILEGAKIGISEELIDFAVTKNKIVKTKTK